MTSRARSSAVFSLAGGGCSQRSFTKKHDPFSLSLVLTLGLPFTAVLPGAELGVPPANPPRIAPASPEAELALKRFQIPPGFQIELFAAEPLLAHPVAFTIDERNRFYVAESFRVGEQVTDIRHHMNWLDEELASTNTAQWRRIVEKYLGNRRDFMTAESERVKLLEDTDGNGRADKATVFADGFNDLQSGIAAGVLARHGEVWFACIPDLWRLRDTNADGTADIREVLHHGYAVRFGFYGHDLHGLRIGPDGKLYFSIGDRGFNVETREGKRVAAPEMGAVLRCELDGANLELFASGLRNPQELAFDQFGNLFTGDNNSDGGDQARWVYAVEGGDSGWRIGWQFITEPVPRGPWNAEKMWQPHNAEQPAYLVPPLANFANGPSGLAYNPGTGLAPEYVNHFLMADFKGTSAQSLIHSFALKPQGASFTVVDRKPFVSQMVATDVEFGLEGGVYIADWVEGWGKTGKGRLYHVYHPDHRTNAITARTRALLGSRLAHQTVPQLAGLLAWPDQRVRQEAQFALAARSAASIPALTEAARHSPHQLARVHAIWGLGQIARGDQRAGASLAPLLRDPDPEIRAQTAKVLGDCRHAPAAGALEALVVDERTPRVQFFAAIALGKLRAKNAAKKIGQMLRDNADRDPYLRHAGVMGLYYLNRPNALRTAAKDDAPAVRMAALLVYRRLGHERVAQFLHDPDPRIVLEAARAIYDLPIAAAMADLAALSNPPSQSAPLLRRVINAHARLGTEASAAALGNLAVNRAVDEAARIEALQSLVAWASPAGRDRVTGLWRPLPAREARVATEVARRILPPLLAQSSTALAAEAARLAARYRIPDTSGELAAIAQSESASAPVRVEALRALAASNDARLPQILERAAGSGAEDVRKEAASLLVKLNPVAGAELLARKLETGTLGEKQAAFLDLGAIEATEADQILAQWLGKLAEGKVEPALQLDLLEAAARRNTPPVQTRLAQFEKGRSTNELGAYVECLAGGNAAAGRKIFFERPEASCARCHKIGNEGAEIGPALDKPDANRAREYLLESIVAPNKTIAPGFENIIVKTKDGTLYAGVLKSESATHLTLHSPEDGVVTMAKADIELRNLGGSGMPEGLGALLSKRDLRDLVEFLATPPTGATR